MRSWLIRAIGLTVLLTAFGFGSSFQPAVAYLSAGAAGAAFPIGPARAATQAGAGVVVFTSAGIATNEAVAFAAGWPEAVRELAGEPLDVAIDSYGGPSLAGALKALRWGASPSRSATQAGPTRPSRRWTGTGVGSVCSAPR